MNNLERLAPHSNNGYRTVVYYNKNLNMSAGKLAAQVAHVVRNLNAGDHFSHRIVVLASRAGKFNRLLEERKEIVLENQENPEQAYYKSFFMEQYDRGLSEVEEGTLTCFAYVEKYDE